MNILEHILAGHYPLDDAGRALVPVGPEAVATIIAVDLPGSWPIVGHVNGTLFQWNQNGYEHQGGDLRVRLCPPSPRKVKVDVLAVVMAGTSTILSIRDGDELTAGVAAGIERLVRLTGEYEEEWT